MSKLFVEKFDIETSKKHYKVKYISTNCAKGFNCTPSTATSVEEIKKILSAGFDYIAEKNGIMLFRRPKRFGALPT